MNLNDAIELTNGIIRENKDLFEDNVVKLDPARIWEGPGPDGIKYIKLYWPYETGKHSTDGLKLKDSAGFISIEIIYEIGRRNILTERGHTFRYFNLNHEYDMKHHPTGNSDSSNYTFRYDSDFRPESDEKFPEHLQVLHNLPRFITKDVELNQFFNVIRLGCFDESTIGLKVPFFAN